MSRIKQQYQLTYEEAAHAAAIATAMMVRKCSEVVEPHVGFSIAAYGFVEGTKTVPQRIEPPVTEKDKKKWYKVW